MNILQIGCNLDNNYVYDFVKDNNCKNIILIDANPNVISQCEKKYESLNKNIFFFNYAITPHDSEEETIKLYIPKNNLTSSDSSIYPDIIKKYGHKELNVIEVQRISINTFLTNLNLKSIDRLYFDIEELDMDIILSLNLDNIDIKYLYCNGSHTQCQNLKKTIEKLKKYNFIEINSDNLNLIFTKQ